MIATEDKTEFTLAELIEHFGDRSSAVEAARQKLREWETSYEWHDDLIKEWVAALESMGFENAEISFSGFCRQGDGASFTAGIDLGHILRFMVSDLDKESDHYWAYKLIDHNPCDGAYVWMWHVMESEEFDGMVYAKIDRTKSRYSHKHTCRTEWDISNFPEMDDEIHALLVSFMGEVEHLRLRLCDVIYKSLNDEYDYRVSDEPLLETAEANDYLFDEDGDYLI
jgi:hypothetical protein